MEELIKKIHSAILEMMKDVSFDEENHQYIRKSDGQFLAGVSSVSDILPKPFLMPWAAKMVVEFLQDRQTDIKEYSESQYLELLNEAKGAYKRKSGEALDLGTEGHSYLESWVLANIRKEKEPILENKELERPINEFKKWAEENIKEWILSEARVADVEGGFAGTLDGLAITKDDKLAVIDFKFANQISASYFIQLAGYSLPFAKYGIDIQDRIVVRLPKTLTKKVYDRKTRQYNEVENNIEIGRSPFSMEYDKETFKHARELYKYINQIKQ